MTRPTKIALGVTLVGYPALRAAELDFYLVGGAQDWWRFWGLAMIGHWACFGLVVWALRRSGEGWATIGVDWSWFVRRRTWLLAFVGLLMVAIIAVSMRPPPAARSGLFPLQAVDLAERLFMFFGAMVTAGVVEETVFRGFAITRVGELLGSPWRALPISMASFFFLHGIPSDPGRIIGILVVGFLFGMGFIVLKCRRLELLVLVHALLNLPLLFMP